LRALGYIPLIINTNHDILLELSSLENLSRLNVEGIVLFATEVTEEHRYFLKKSKIPVLFVGQLCDETHSIINDEKEAGAIIGSYIARLGHRNVLYLGVDEKDILVGKIRKNAVIDELLKFDSKVEVLDSNFSFDESEKVIYEYFKTEKKMNKPTALICATDNMAFGAIKALNRLNIRIPEDMSVVGFGGYRVSDLIIPQLCTIKFWNNLTGELAAESIVKLIGGEKVQKLQKIGFEFLERKSVSNIEK
ncbi:MAG: trehalose repressor, partial [Cetobacterium sp.]